MRWRRTICWSAAPTLSFLTFSCLPCLALSWPSCSELLLGVSLTHLSVYWVAPFPVTFLVLIWTLPDFAPLVVPFSSSFLVLFSSPSSIPLFVLHLILSWAFFAPPSVLPYLLILTIFCSCQDCIHKSVVVFAQHCFPSVLWVNKRFSKLGNKVISLLSLNIYGISYVTGDHVVIWWRRTLSVLTERQLKRWLLLV